VLHGCIPVIVQDGVQLPFENFVDYSAFARARYRRRKSPPLLDTLKVRAPL